MKNQTILSLYLEEKNLNKLNSENFDIIQKHAISIANTSLNDINIDNTIGERYGLIASHLIENNLPSYKNNFSKLITIVLDWKPIDHICENCLCKKMCKLSAKADQIMKTILRDILELLRIIVQKETTVSQLKALQEKEKSLSLILSLCFDSTTLTGLTGCNIEASILEEIFQEVQQITTLFLNESQQIFDKYKESKKLLELFVNIFKKFHRIGKCI